MANSRTTTRLYIDDETRPSSDGDTQALHGPARPDEPGYEDVIQFQFQHAISGPAGWLVSHGEKP